MCNLIHPFDIAFPIEEGLFLKTNLDKVVPKDIMPVHTDIKCLEESKLLISSWIDAKGNKSSVSIKPVGWGALAINKKNQVSVWFARVSATTQIPVFYKDFFCSLIKKLHNSS